MRIKYQPTVPNSLNSSLNDVSTNLQNIQTAIRELGNGNIAIGFNNDEYHGHYIVIEDNIKKIRFTYAEKSGTGITTF